MREIAGSFEVLNQGLGSWLALDCVAWYGNVSASRHKLKDCDADSVQSPDRGMRKQVQMRKVSHTYISVWFSLTPGQRDQCSRSYASLLLGLAGFAPAYAVP